MDLKSLAQRSKAQLHLRHPVSKAPLYHEGDNGVREAVVIDVMSIDSDVFRRRKNERANAAVQRLEENGSTYMTAEDRFRQETYYLVDLIAGWNIVYDGKTPDVTDEPAMVSFFENPEMGWLRKQVDDFAALRANFIGASSATSSGTQNAGPQASA